MRIFLNEIKKLLSTKLFLVCLAVLFLSNIFIMYYSQHNDYNTQAIVNDKVWYEQTIAQIENMTANQAIKFLKKEETILIIADTIKDLKNDGGDMNSIETFRLEEYKSNYHGEYNVALKTNIDDIDIGTRITNIQNIQSQIKYIDEYDDFINEMEQRVDSLKNFSIFSKPGTFSYNNISKTAQDFENLKGIELKAGNNLLLETVTTYSVTDYMLFALIILMCISLFSYEKEKGLNRLIRSTVNGRLNTIVCKFSVILFFTVFIGIVYYSSIIISCGLYCGFGDLQRNVQSSEMLFNCNFNVTVWQYLLLWVLGKIAIMCTIACFSALMFLVIRNTSLVFVVIGIVLLIEYIFYVKINGDAIFNQLKYINCFYMLTGNNIFGNYLNVDFFAIPVNITIIFIIFALVLSSAFVIIGCCVFINKSITAGEIALPCVQRIKEKFAKIRGSVNLLNGESFKHYKISFVGVGIVLLVIFAFNNFNADIDIVYQDTAQNYYSEYMETLQGEITPEKDEFLKKEQAYFDDLLKQSTKISNDNTLSDEIKQQKIAGIQTVLDGKGQAFDKVLEQREYVEKISKKIEKKPEFINELIYSRLLKNSQREWEYFTIIILFIIFSASNLFAYEHKKDMTNLIRCTLKGKRQLVKTKIGVMFITGTIGYILVYLPYMINYLRTFGNVNIFAPVIYLPDFQSVNSSISILQMLLLESCVHICVVFAVAMVTIMLSQLTKSNVLAMIISATVSLFPCLICVNAERLRLYNTFITGSWYWFIPIVIIVSIIIGILCVLMTTVNFTDASLRRRS